MKKIKKVSEHQSHLFTTGFEVDCGMFQVDINVFSRAEDMEFKFKLFNIDIEDMDFEFKIDGKRCDRNGFKELYEKLFGKGKFDDFDAELADYVKKEFFENTDLPCVQNISVSKAKKYLSDLLTEFTYPTGTVMLDDEEVLYIDQWNIIGLARIADPDNVHRIKCKAANNPSGNEFAHAIYDIDAYFCGK